MAISAAEADVSYGTLGVRTAVHGTPLTSLLQTMSAGLKAVDGAEQTARVLASPEIGHHILQAERVVAIALGKVAYSGIQGIRAALGDRLETCVAVTGEHYLTPDADLVLTGDHPNPGPRSAAAWRGLERFIAGLRLTSKDLVIVLVSGGTTALLSHPVPSLTEEDLRQVSHHLIRSGASVSEANELRKAISVAHGGGLLDRLAPARCLNLIVCDNIQYGDRAVGSAPTLPGVLRPDRARKVAMRYLPAGPLRERLSRVITELPLRRGHRTEVVGSHHVTGPAEAFTAMNQHLSGWPTVSLGPSLQGDVKEVARLFADRLREVRDPIEPVFVVGAGETTVRVNGTGRGGRCQELAWTVAHEMGAEQDFVFAAVASDGVDNLPGVAGAWVDDRSWVRTRDRGIVAADILANNDSYTAHAAVGQIIRAPAGRTNVCDLYVACRLPSRR